MAKKNKKEKKKVKELNQKKQNFLIKTKLFIKAKRDIIMWILVLLAAIGGYFASELIQKQKRAMINKKVLEKQNNVMKDFWQEKGMGDEEINKRLERSGDMREKMLDRQNTDEGSESGNMPREGVPPGTMRMMR